MNDFTKEELQLLAESIPYLLHMQTKARTDLLMKIDTMIDNYCEHSESHANHDYEVEQCKKCGKLFV